MGLTSTTSGDGEVAQKLASATSEWGLGREAQAASSVLRVKTGPECPEDNLRELKWNSKPKEGIARDKRKKAFPRKCS